MVAGASGSPVTGFDALLRPFREDDVQVEMQRLRQRG